MFANKRGRKSNYVACIFVHAGAGYHSVQNENAHLQACNDACKAAMGFLKGGGTAMDAVEIALKVLEDREITNAGYGSNLAIDGVAECDAVVVDHYGRSGGVSSVTQIKNPVSLARLILDMSMRTLSLRRVPPNLLVGQGATEFAYENGMLVHPIDALISPAANDRWKRWQKEMNNDERRRREAGYYKNPEPSSAGDLGNTQRPAIETMRVIHSRGMRASVWNEAQPISPPPSDDRRAIDDSLLPSQSSSSMSLKDSNSTTPESLLQEFMDPHGPPGLWASKHAPPMNSDSTRALTSAPQGSDGLEQHDSDSVSVEDDDVVYPGEAPFDAGLCPIEYWRQESGSDSESDATITRSNHRKKVKTSEGSQAGDDPFADPSGIEEQERPTPSASTPHDHDKSNSPPRPDPRISHVGNNHETDVITDTVGAIAVDIHGNIACGASSGGIGMKHRGRIGPAALVGIGAHVIPPDDDDMERTSVATVTSGTGEHMATTMAAQTCSDRVYHSERKVPGGGYENCIEDEAVEGFIKKDFMGHPSVKASNSSGAIGLLSVKRTREGVYLYFGHNTDSFALASMHSDESKPVCTMSRSKGNGTMAQGGRPIRYSRKKKL